MDDELSLSEEALRRYVELCPERMPVAGDAPAPGVRTVCHRSVEAVRGTVCYVPLSLSVERQ